MTWATLIEATIIRSQQGTKPRIWRIGQARMHTIELLALAVQVAKQAGYQIRHDWFGGTGGGGCEFGGQKWIFLDLALNPRERLDQIEGVLQMDLSLTGLVLPAPLAQLWNYPKAA